MSDHVAVLRFIRETDYPEDKEGRPQYTDERAALDHAIATCEQHAALVTRLGELEAREAAWYDLVQRAWQVLDIECPNEEITDELLAALTNAARVVAGNGGGE